MQDPNLSDMRLLRRESGRKRIVLWGHLIRRSTELKRKTHISGGKTVNTEVEGSEGEKKPPERK